jgi:uncharacterized protein (TIGR01777 family)
MGGDRMHVVIAGGSGLIGRQLTMNLADDGDEVIILSRHPGEVLGLPKGAKAVEWDGKTLQDWMQYIDNSDVVINLTGENLSGKGLFPSRWTEERKSRLLQSRVNSGTVLTQAIEHAKTKPSVFIQASGINYYGTQGDKPVTEADAAGNDFLANLSKEWEASSQLVESMGIRRVVVRNGIVLSTKAGALPVITLPYRLYVGGPLGNGRQVFSWIHLQDEVSAIQFLLHDPQAYGAYNLTSPNPVTNDEFGKTIGKVIHRPHYFKIPGFAMRLALGEVSMMVLEGQTVIPQKLIEAGFEFEFPTLDDALRDLLSKSDA